MAKGKTTAMDAEDRAEMKRGKKPSAAEEKAEGSKKLPPSAYSAKKAAAGKDIGKKGKNFAKIAEKAGKKYGSKAAGEKVAGAILAKMRGKR
jgi:hypothetical protein